MPFIDFAVTTNFTFLTGGSHPEELAARAAGLGHPAIGIADVNSVAGVVRAHVAARDVNAERPANDDPAKAPPFRVHPGARLRFVDGTPDLLAYPVDRAGWGRLTRLLTVGNRRAEKGRCDLTLNDVLAGGEGLSFILIAGERDPVSVLSRLREAFPGAVRLGLGLRLGGEDRRRLFVTRGQAEAAGVPLIALGETLYHAPERRPLQDVLTCIREGVRLEAAGYRLEANAERHLKPAEEMLALFADAPEAVAETLALSAELRFSLDDLSYDYPDEGRDGFADPQAALEAFTAEGARRRYPHGVPETVTRAIAHELKLIGALGYAPYFLTVHDIVRFARERGILAQGRGSAANSAVCFCLGVTEVDPEKSDLLFERFVSAERREPPDIDVDFEHERREEVIQWIYARYGRERAGLAASVITYRARSAVREVGKVFGLSTDLLDRISSSIWGWSDAAVRDQDMRRLGLDPTQTQFAHVLALSREIIGFPRHLSQHTGGFVITRGRLDEVVPIQNAAMADRTVVEWDKDDLDALGILKIDVLALGMLTCLRKAYDLVARHYGRPLTTATLPPEDPATYRMIQRADTLGVFQIESRAQMTMLPRLKPKTFYDLVIEVAIVRPGPIQGDMVHPYLRRRQGLESVSFPSPHPDFGPKDELAQVLGKTLGVPLFQEQAMKIAIVAAGFSPGEADRLRRAMATFRKVGTIGTFAEKMVRGMVARGYDAAFAERCFRQIEGFGEYGFPESHAASFALLVYASCWLKCHYPDAFACALLNAQPMGFYSSAQIVRDVREHGVEVRPVDVNFSTWDSRLEPGPHAATLLHAGHADMCGDVWATHAIRLGFREVKGLSAADMARIEAARGRGFDSIRDVWLRTGLSPAVLERLAEADAFGSLGLARRDALWAVKALGRAGDKDDLPLFASAGATRDPRFMEPDVALTPMLPGEEVVEDYRFMKLSLKAHPLALLRGHLPSPRFMAHEGLRTAGQNQRVAVCGLVLVRQRPGSAKGVVFMTLEDETGVANVIVWPSLFEQFRPVILGARLVMVEGRVQNEAGVIHVVAERLVDRTALLAHLSEEGEEIEALANADEVRRPQDDHRDKRIKAGKAIRLRDLIRDVPELAGERFIVPDPAPADPANDSARADLLGDRIGADLDASARATRHKPSGRPRAARSPSLDPPAASVLPKGRNFR